MNGFIVEISDILVLKMLVNNLSKSFGAILAKIYVPLCLKRLLTHGWRRRRRRWRRSNNLPLIVAETDANVFVEYLRTWPDKQSWGTPSNVQSPTNYLHDKISNFVSGLFPWMLKTCLSSCVTRTYEESLAKTWNAGGKDLQNGW